MINVNFTYDSGTKVQCKFITKIEILTNGNYIQISDDQLLTYHFSANTDYFLYSDSSNYFVSCKNLISIEITKH